MQIFKGTLDDKTAILSINHCDYRDGGDYVCEWVSDDTKLSGWSSISIRGKIDFVCNLSMTLFKINLLL